LHVQLSHPSLSQLKQVFCRAYFCLDLNTKARKVCESCHTCASLKTVPNNYHKQTTSPPSKVIGSRYSADVIRRYSQYILLLREDISSYTEATLIENEKAETLRDGLTQLSSRLRSPLSPQAVIRTDPASSLRSLAIDKSLAQFNLSIEIGEPKNVNHNPIAEKAIRELEEEIVRLIPLGGKISSSLLARAVSQLNSRIRYSKLSAVEMFTSRDMATGQQLELEDKKLIADKQMIRENHHHASAKFRARGKDEVKYPPVSVGDIVYLSSDKSKLRGREKYIITKMEEDYVFVQKFTESQLRSRIYKVKKSDVIKVPTDTAEQVTELPSNPTDSIARSDNPTRSRVFYRSKPYQKHAHHHILRPPTNVNYRESSSDESDDDNSIIQIPSRFTYPNATQDNSDRDEDPDPTQDPAEGRQRRLPLYLNDYELDLTNVLNELEDEAQIEDGETEDDPRDDDVTRSSDEKDATDESVHYEEDDPRDEEVNEKDATDESVHHEELEVIDARHHVLRTPANVNYKETSSDESEF
jgi:hypothetical protein